MEFWKWYLKGILNLPGRLFSLRVMRALISPTGELTFGLIVIAWGSVLVIVILSPVWLLLTMSVGVTMVAHSYWRWKK